jgi:hypothetical protein
MREREIENHASGREFGRRGKIRKGKKKIRGKGKNKKRNK